MKVSFIGAGAMAGAIAKGAHAAEPGKWKFTFYDVFPQSAKDLAAATGGKVAVQYEDALAGAAIIVLAVKPKDQAAVIEQLPETSATIVSIAAGISTEQIADNFAERGQAPPVVRVMPNVNASVGAATSAVCAGQAAEPIQVAQVRDLFNTVGQTVEIPEELFPPFTALAGSSPAFFFQIIEHLAAAGVKHGLTKDQALLAANSTMAGSARLLAEALEDGQNTQDLIDRVSSPGGTTIAGLLAAEGAGLGPSLVAAVDATVAKDRELGHLS